MVSPFCPGVRNRSTTDIEVAHCVNNGRFKSVALLYSLPYVRGDTAMIGTRRTVTGLPLEHKPMVVIVVIRIN